MVENMKKVLILNISIALIALFAISSAQDKAAATRDQYDQPYWGAAYSDKAPVYDFDVPDGEMNKPDPGTILQGGDNIGTAYVIPGLPFHDSGTTSGYASDWDPICCGGCMYGPDVVYAYTPDVDVVVDINTCGTSFYDVLYVFENSDANVLACEDWYDVCPPNSGLDRLQLYAGNTYYFVIDGYWGSQGPYEFDINEHSVPECPPEAISENEPGCGGGYVDNFNGGCNSNPAVFSEINIGDIICGTSGTFVRNDTLFRDTDWYRLELTEQKLLHWHVVSEFPAQAFIFDGADENCENIQDAIQGQAPPLDTIHIAHNALPGVYYFYVSPVSFAGYECPMAYTAWLTVEDPPPAPANDNCEDVIAQQLIPDNPLIIEGNTIGATVQCRSLELIPEVWTAFTIDVMANIKIEYCGTSPYFGGCYIVLANECPCSDLIYFTSYNQWECGDNNYTLTWDNLPAGTYYYPIMSKWGSAYGDYHITLSSNSVNPGIAVSPEEIAGQAAPGSFTTIELSIGNIGYGELDFTLDAVQDEPTPEWLSISQTEGAIPVGDPEATITVTMDAASLTEGTYTGHITVASNAPDKPEVTLPVTFNVGVPGYEYLPGDANMGIGTWPPAVIGSDVTYLVNFFRDLTTNPSCLLSDFYCAADVNADCRVIGSDVTRLVNFFRGSGAIEPCPDYLPVWLTPADCPAEAPEGWPNCE